MLFFKKLYRKFIKKQAAETQNPVIKNWELLGKPLPIPHLVKQMIINDIRNKFQYHLFVETGTYLGDMVEAQINNFKTIYSIELGDSLYKDAVEKFKDYQHVTIMNGDSGEVLVHLCAQINEPAIFWLDGHYSAGVTAKGNKECPIFEELTAIFNSAAFNHVLLIDDARLFIGENDYPTKSELFNFIKSHRANATITVENDIIQVFL
jgi:hypothetical protein